MTTALKLLEAILPHVAFDGWSEGAFAAAAEDCGASLEEARALCPRGASDLAVLFHTEGDAAMVAALRRLARITATLSRVADAL